MRRRPETRAERYAAKARVARTLGFSLVTVEFMNDGNLGYVVRAAACYGAREVHVIGHVPPYADLHRLSGGTDKLVRLFQHGDCHEFLEWKRVTDPSGRVVSIELRDGSSDLTRFSFCRGVHNYLVVGNEETGVPEELIHRSDDLVHIPMPGPGFCLNTSQAANAVAYEFVRQAV